jgi:hypothetical protein
VLLVRVAVLHRDRHALRLPPCKGVDISTRRAKSKFLD